MNPHYIDPGHLAKVLNGDASGNNVTAPGPNNIDRRHDRSMSITVDPYAPDGFVVHSHSAKNTDLECKDYVRRHLGLGDWKPTPREQDKPRVKPTIVGHYIYEDRDGEPYLRVTRKSDKTFAQYHWNGFDDWDYGKPTGPVIPYRLPDILANADQIIHLVEGEKSADYLRSVGLIATTAPGGGSAFPTTSDFAVWFDGQRVRAYPDNDPTGHKWAERVAKALPDAEIIWLPDQPAKAGADDWLQREGRTVDDLINAVSDEYRQEAETPVTEPEASQPIRIRPTPFVYVDGETIPPREWLYDNHLIRKFVSLTVSPGGLGKSSLALIEALSMTSNRALFDDAVLHEPEPLRVWYWNGEDPQEETQRRVIAAARHYGLKAADFAPRLFTDSGREQQIIMGNIAKGQIEIDDGLFEAIEAEIIANNIDVFILDPFVSSHRMGENDNNAIDAVVKRLGTLADRCNCAVEIIHHIRKPSAGSTAATDINDARGASALVGGVRSGRVLSVMPEDIATAAAIPADLRLRHFSITDGKANMSASMGEAKWRFLESVCLNNQTDRRKADNVGVVTYFKLPESARVMADLSQAETSAARILRSDDTVRHWAGKGKKPKNWLGHRILDDLGIHDGDHDSTLQKLITGWLKDGVFVVRTAYEENNRTAFLTIPGTVEIEPESSDPVPF